MNHIKHFVASQLSHSLSQLPSDGPGGRETNRRDPDRGKLSRAELSWLFRDELGYR